MKGQIIILEKLNEAILYLLLLNKRKTEKNLPAKHYREQNKIVVYKRTKITHVSYRRRIDSWRFPISSFPRESVCAPINH